MSIWRLYSGLCPVACALYGLTKRHSPTYANQTVKIIMEDDIKYEHDNVWAVAVVGSTLPSAISIKWVQLPAAENFDLAHLRGCLDDWWEWE